MNAALASILAWFGPALDSAKGYVNGTELARAVLAGLGTSSIAGLALNVVNAILADKAIFDPSLSSLVAGIGVVVVDVLRRLDHQS